MAWVTALGPSMDVIEYRLRESVGCAVDIDVSAYIDGGAAPEERIEWIGEGLREVDIEPGTLMSEADKDAARLLADGRDPRNKERLVKPKMAVAPQAKVPAKPLVDAVYAHARRRGVSVEDVFAEEPAIAKRFEELDRGVKRSGEHHLAAISDVSRVAISADVSLRALYPGAMLDLAWAHVDDKVRVGNRGFDITLDCPKSFSVLEGLAHPDMAVKLRQIHAEAVRETVAALEGWVGYTVSGHHGDGGEAQRVDASGLLGWFSVHRTARAVGDAAPDPHLHAHVTIMNMARGEDGKWRTVAAGGRDFYRHAKPTHALFNALIRHKSARVGVEWRQDPRSKVWEVVGVSPQARQLYSKRSQQVNELVTAAQPASTEVSAVASKAVAGMSASAKRSWRSTELRADWSHQKALAGVEAPSMTAAGPPVVYEPVDVAAVAERVFDPHEGLTGHRKAFSRTDAMAAVLEALPGGVTGEESLQSLTDQVLRHGGIAVALNNGAGAFLSNADRYTTRDVVEAEVAILTAAKQRLHADYSPVPAETVAAVVSDFDSRHPFNLSSEQRAVVQRLCQTGHGIDMVQGVAGAGKTTIMEVVAEAYRRQGFRVAGVSTAAVAAHHLEAATGIASTTIATRLLQTDPDKGLAGIDVLIVDEAAMVDDRQLAQLVKAAGRSGTKIIGIGDDKQLRSPGVGSVFTDVHQRIRGLTLTENRRQRDETHQWALRLWRDDQRRAALTTFAKSGCVHATDSLEETFAAMVSHWWLQQSRFRSAHEAIAGHLMLAGTNEDVAVLNDAVQALRLATGALDGSRGRDFRVPGGQSIRLHVGDHVMLRTNTPKGTQIHGKWYRDAQPRVFNGYRGVITAVDDVKGSVTVQWRTKVRRQSVVQERVIHSRYIAEGGLELGYALTINKAQGQDAETVATNITGMDPRAAYPALSRHKGRVDAWIARDVVESEEVKAQLGEVTSEGQRLQRALDAYADWLERADPEELAIAELGGYEHLLDHRPPQPVSDKSASEEDAKRPAQWWAREFGGLTPAELDERVTDLRSFVDSAESELAAWQERRNEIASVQADAAAAAAAGRGETVAALEHKRELLARAVEHERLASEAGEQAQKARDAVTLTYQRLRHHQHEHDSTTWRRDPFGASRREHAAAIDGLESKLRRQSVRREAAESAQRAQEAARRQALRDAEVSVHSSAVETVRELDSGWDARVAEATARDTEVATAPSALTTEVLDPRPHRDSDVSQARRELAGLLAENDIREGLHPKALDYETRDRASARVDAEQHVARDEAVPSEPSSPRLVAAIDAEREARRRVHEARPDPEPSDLAKRALRQRLKDVSKVKGLEK